MSEFQIKPANNNKDRQKTYTVQLGRYRKAVKEGFYFEALIIVYSLLEDRLKSILYYAGVYKNRNNKSISKETKADLYELYEKKYGEGSVIQLNKISGKMNLISAIIDWESNTQKVDEENIYLYELKILFEDIDIGGILDTFTELKSWLAYRNEIIHASMNKNIDELNSNLPEKIELGMEYARFLDSQVKIMKKSNRVRKALNMQNN